RRATTRHILPSVPRAPKTPPALATRQRISAAFNGPDSIVQSLPSQLIRYHRPDRAQARASEYSLVTLPCGDDLRILLAEALGITVEVIKRRTVYLHDNVRIHLDDVERLGTYLEF